MASSFLYVCLFLPLMELASLIDAMQPLYEEFLVRTVAQPKKQKPLYMS